MDPETGIVTISSSYLLNNWARIVDDLAEHTGRRYVITRWRKPYAVLVSPERDAEAEAAIAAVRAAAERERTGTRPGERPRLRGTESGSDE